MTTPGLTKRSEPQEFSEAPDQWTKTIIGRAFEPLRKLSIDPPGPAVLPDREFGQQVFKIRLATTNDRRSSASVLIKKMYSWRGYETNGTAPEGQSNRVTLVAAASEQSIGTLTIGFDSSIGLLVDELYKDRIDQLRGTGCRVCELTKLAVDERIRSKRVLASLFHIAYIYARNFHHCTDMVIEVNPRHVRFYERMLGFERLGEKKMCERVQAPAVLLHLKLEYARQQIDAFGGLGEQAGKEKSLYPYAFSAEEEVGITKRLTREPEPSSNLPPR